MSESTMRRLHEATLCVVPCPSVYPFISGLLRKICMLNQDMLLDVGADKGRDVL